ncbi:restriction endonuclease subunit S [Cronobacter muytjensii]|nr:restriction endonuclease subunit S [Cronobacter muytjensii]
MAKYKAYPEYKDSGVEWLGAVPSHWEILSAKRMFQSVRTPAYKSDEQLAASQKYGVIPQSLMMQLNDSKVMLALKGTESFRHVEANNFVISLRSFEGGIEYSQYTGCVSPAYTVLKNSKPISYGYYRYLLKCMPFIAALQSSTDSLRDGKSINYEQFSALSLPLSSVQEQNVIAVFLDHETAKIDNLIEKQQQLIEILKEKRQAVISHAVTKGLNPDVPMKDSGVEWLGKVPEHWTVSTIKYISTFIGTGGTPKNPESFTDDDGMDWFTPGDFNGSLVLQNAKKKITTQAVSNGDAKSYPKNSIVVIGIGATLGKVAFVEHEFSCNQQINIITPGKTVEYKYLTYSLLNQVEQMKQSSNASTIGIMNQEKTKQIWIAFPSKDEQIKIVNTLSQKEIEFDSLLNKSEYQILLLQERRTALISAAVTGKIDVRDWVAPDTQDVEEPQEATA